MRSENIEKETMRYQLVKWWLAEHKQQVFNPPTLLHI